MKLDRNYYLELIELLAPELIMFRNEGNGIILRHDIDDLFERSYKMAQLEFSQGIRSTYFVLDTATYFQPENSLLWDQLLQMQNEWHHEIAWHNNALTGHFLSGLPAKTFIEAPLKILRDHGLKIKGTSSHGDPACYQFNFINYNVFGFPHKDFTGYKGETFKLSDFGLDYEASHNGHKSYFSDSHGRFTLDPKVTIRGWIYNPARYQITIHPEWWTI